MFFPAPTHTQRGMVLIVVLGALTLLSLLLIVLLEGAAHETRSAESSSVQIREKIAADSALALVISQITQATSPVGQAWISQPGLLRTYTAASGRHPTACYKLYSSLQMTDLSGSLDFLATEIPEDWSTDSSGYVDLNQPVHPAGLLSSAIYPIFDPAAVSQVEGLSIDASHGPEMPVAWLYQLQDGSVGPASRATLSNPLVTRMAFWTDDDTCKVNLNTAGCGSPWDVPRLNSQDDVTWSTTAPAWGEYPRYPGHPASTSLQGIFGLGLGGLTPDELLNLSPRYATGGSDFGTQPTSAGEILAGKFVIASLNQVPALFFQTHPGYAQTTLRQAHNLRFADGTGACFASGNVSLVRSASYPSTTQTWSVPDWENKTTLLSYSLPLTAPCSAPTGSLGVTMLPPGGPLNGLAGDWDTGPGFAPDGALINLPDAGTDLTPYTAYFSLKGGEQGAPTQRAPNALVASPVALGSLPAGLNPDQPNQSQPWRTLLFCPYPAADAAHPGFASPPDSLLLDQFWMPVVDPYPISTCFVTAGKVNLNDQILPFTYLHRQTALRAVLRDLRVAALSPGLAAQAKSPGAPLASVWLPLDATATMAVLENRFTSGDAYLSASEICAVPLVPQGQTAATLDHFWESNTGGGHLTGDNLRERPYDLIYSRLTTRSNSYTVHVWVQTLKKNAARSTAGYLESKRPDYR